MFRSRQPQTKAAFTCPASTHKGRCTLETVAAKSTTKSATVINTAVVVHGAISEKDFTDVRTSHPGRHITLDDNVLVLWPGGGA
ncbi:hypothetical protein [Streptomyces sp. NPDC005423]|uniref:hypothetical protein n=1 Tax=Streptomyces sp. NPDC005423 TaxID=3155343 RepID=UPI00339F9357